MSDVASGITETWAVVRDRSGTEYAHVFLTFRAFYDEDDEDWVGECIDLSVSSAADGPFEALESVLEATMIYLHTLEETGQRRRVFEEQGLELHWRLPALSESDHRQVDLRPNEYVMARFVAHRGEFTAH